MKYGAVEFVCGGCERREAGWFNRQGYAIKPSHWYIRTDDAGTQVACSRRCIDVIRDKSGVKSFVAPF